jgi:hypothetical protein
MQQRKDSTQDYLLMLLALQARQAASGCPTLYRAHCATPTATARPLACRLQHHRSETEGNQEDTFMDLAVWLPGMFLLGLVSMIGCYVFISACEKI